MNLALEKLSFLMPLCVIGLLAVIPMARADLCKDPRIGHLVKQAINEADPSIQPCISKTAPFLDDAGFHNIEYAVVLREAKMAIDVIGARYDTLVLFPDGALLNLGDYLALPIPGVRAEDYLLEALHISPADAGGYCCIDWKLFFAAAYLERYPDHRLCVTYAMKSPFRGSFRDCGEREKPMGDIGYARGVVSWQQARDITCGCKGGWVGTT